MSDGGGLERCSSVVTSMGSGIRTSVVTVEMDSLTLDGSLHIGASELDSSSSGSSFPLLLTLDGGSRFAIDNGSSNLSSRSLLELDTHIGSWLIS